HKSNHHMLYDQNHMRLKHSQVSDARVSGDINISIQSLLDLGPRVLAQKRGAAGATVHLVSNGGSPTKIDVPGFPVEVSNILGAGDAFASGFLYGFVKGWDWYKTTRLANACGAIVVTKHGCPT